MAADRGAFICQSQSMNVHIADPNTSKLTSMHFYAWKKGLKTGMYYLRTRPKADAIQFTVNQEMLAETNINRNKQRQDDMVNDGSHLKSKFAGLTMKDDEDECLNCGA